MREKVKDGYEVIIGNPELIKTGLDLLDFPTLVFFQTGYNTFTLRQASRRSWRIGQTREVKVVYLYYQHTMQERALQLIGAKLEASMGIEGRFSEEGLIAMSSGDDMMNALAKTIVGNIAPTDAAEVIWKRMAKHPGGLVATHQTNAPLPQSDTNTSVVLVEWITMSGKRKTREVLEVEKSRLETILKEKSGSGMAQMLLF